MYLFCSLSSWARGKFLSRGELFQIDKCPALVPGIHEPFSPHQTLSRGSPDKEWQQARRFYPDAPINNEDSVAAGGKANAGRDARLFQCGQASRCPAQKRQLLRIPQDVAFIPHRPLQFVQAQREVQADSFAQPPAIGIVQPSVRADEAQGSARLQHIEPFLE